ncbi:MAG: hypothetical protein ACLSE6_07530, partial [Alphaproteobacteria bacterium]
MAWKYYDVVPKTLIIMSRILTMEDGLQKMKKAFPEDACFLSEMPVLSSVFTGCEKTIHFCLVVYAKGMYYVKEMLSGHTYKT